MDGYNFNDPRLDEPKRVNRSSLFRHRLSFSFYPLPFAPFTYPSFMHELPASQPVE